MVTNEEKGIWGCLWKKECYTEIMTREWGLVELNFEFNLCNSKVPNSYIKQFWKARWLLSSKWHYHLKAGFSSVDAPLKWLDNYLEIFWKKSQRCFWMWSPGLKPDFLMHVILHIFAAVAYINLSWSVRIILEKIILCCFFALLTLSFHSAIKQCTRNPGKSSGHLLFGCPLSFTFMSFSSVNF